MREKRREGRRDIESRGFVEGGQQIRRRCGASLVPAEIVPNPLAERVGAHPMLEHRKNGAAFRIRDHVEGVLDVVVARDWLANAPGARKAVERHRTVRRREAGEIGAVLRVQLVHHLVAHPGGERLVEPDVVPPGHGDEVAEPLVRELVRHDVRERAPLAFGCPLGVEQQEPFAEGDEPDVLHRA